MATKNPKKTVKTIKTTEVVETSRVVTVKSTLPSVTELIKETWQNLKTNFGSFTILFFIQTFASVLVFGIALIIGIAGGLGAGLQGQNLETLMQGTNWVPVAMTAGAVVAALFVIATIILTVLTMVFQGAMIAVAASGEAKMSVGEALRVGRSKVVPLLVASLVGGILVWGGLFALVIPGLVIGILFSMAMFAVILDDYKGVDSLRASATLVKQYFWEVLGRIVVLVILSFVASIALSIVIEFCRRLLGEDFAALVSFILNMIFNIGSMAFTIIFMTTLYQQLRQAGDTARVVSLKWMVVAGIIGLVLFSFVAVSVVGAVRAIIQNWPAIVEQNPDLQNLETELESGTPMTEEEWESIMRDAMEEATASGQTNGPETSPMMLDY